MEICVFTHILKPLVLAVLTSLLSQKRRKVARPFRAARPVLHAFVEDRHARMMDARLQIRCGRRVRLTTAAILADCTGGDVAVWPNIE